MVEAGEEGEEEGEKMPRRMGTGRPAQETVQVRWGRSMPTWAALGMGVLRVVGMPVV